MVTGLVNLDLAMCARLCHQLARNAGWWNDLETGKPVERDMGEAFALIHSEVSEAFEGWRKGINDDHLPQRPMVEVELADTLIRIFDTAGGMGWSLIECDDPSGDVVEFSTGTRFADLHELVTDAWAGWKMSLPSDRVVDANLGLAVAGIRGLAGVLDLDLTGAMVEKLAYNLNRADHKREARLAEGGKKC